MGYISTVMVKDLSRLGRDYVSVGYYTDQHFPERNIRFIAVNDMVDSDEGENEIAPFKNIMNEMYARDISRKIRSSHRIRGNLGEPLSQPPYGYRKSPENKKKWIIDPEPAAIVKRIFRMCLDGMGNETIARILQEEKVLNPTAYWQSQGINRSGKKTQPNPYRWCNKSIHYFTCSNYVKDTRGECLQRHYIRADSLELRRMAAMLRADEERFADILAQKTNRDILNEKKASEIELQRAIARNEAVMKLYEKLYEDNANGKVTDEWFMTLSHKYEVERMELKEKIAELRKRLDDMGNCQQGREAFLNAIRKFMEMGTLTAPLLHELIDHIVVHETEGTGKNRTQRVEIFYRFVGYIVIPDDYFCGNYVANTRQGVAVKYLPTIPA